MRFIMTFLAAFGGSALGAYMLSNVMISQHKRQLSRFKAELNDAYNDRLEKIVQKKL